jgi:UPF0716 family protein affecting phage T7 exclusion
MIWFAATIGIYLGVCVLIFGAIFGAGGTKPDYYEE